MWIFVFRKIQKRTLRHVNKRLNLHSTDMKCLTAQIVISSLVLEKNHLSHLLANFFRRRKKWNENALSRIIFTYSIKTRTKHFDLSNFNVNLWPSKSF